MNSTIRTNMDSIRNYNIFSKNQTAASSAMTRATTGLRIASVADGPADWAVSEKMRERINSLNQANQNIQNDTAMMKTAADGIANTVEILRTLKARVLNAADAATAEEDRTVLAKEIDGLVKQITDNANNVKYNGKTLLDGTYAGSATESADAAAGGAATESGGNGKTLYFQVGDTASTKIDVNIGNMTLKGLGLDALSGGISDAKTMLSYATESAGAVAGGAATESVSTAITDAGSFIDALNSAIDSALEAATSVGSLEQRLGYTADNVNAQIENLQASNSALVDADMAKEISDYLKWNALSQASQYMLAQSNQNAYSALNLFQ